MLDRVSPLMCVPPFEVGKLWPVLRPMIEDAFAKCDRFVPENFRARLDSGDLLAWIGTPDGDQITLLVVTSIVVHPSGRACELVICSGDALPSMPRWTAQIEQYARGEKCVKGFADGRVGWARVLPGYKVKRVVVEKVL